jgi:hypothetical protein
LRENNACRNDEYRFHCIDNSNSIVDSLENEDAEPPTITNTTNKEQTPSEGDIKKGSRERVHTDTTDMFMAGERK